MICTNKKNKNKNSEMKLVQSLASIFSRFTRAQQWSSEQAKAFILHHHQHHQHHHHISSSSSSSSNEWSSEKGECLQSAEFALGRCLHVKCNVSEGKGCLYFVFQFVFRICNCIFVFCIRDTQVRL